jgi:hypothetical protein
MWLAQNAASLGWQLAESFRVLAWFQSRIQMVVVVVLTEQDPAGSKDSLDFSVPESHRQVLTSR